MFIAGLEIVKIGLRLKYQRSVWRPRIVPRKTSPPMTSERELSAGYAESRLTSLGTQINLLSHPQCQFNP